LLACREGREAGRDVGRGRWKGATGREAAGRRRRAREVEWRSVSLLLLSQSMVPSMQSTNPAGSTAGTHQLLGEHVLLKRAQPLEVVGAAQQALHLGHRQAARLVGLHGGVPGRRKEGLGEGWAGEGRERGDRECPHLLHYAGAHRCCSCIAWAGWEGWR
jgi:hypothetical protein